MKRVLAIIGIIILLGLYVATLVVAIAGGPNFLPMLQACLVATVAVPVIIHLFLVMKMSGTGDLFLTILTPTEKHPQTKIPGETMKVSLTLRTKNHKSSAIS